MTFDITTISPLDKFECAHFDITDDFLKNAKIAAYMCNQELQKSDGEEKPYAPKTFPEKAIDIMIPFSDDFIVEIFLDSNEYVWDSKFKYNGNICKLSPDQMQQFFNTKSYADMVAALPNRWPLTDPTYAKLYAAVQAKQMKIGFTESDLIDEDNQLTEKDQPNKHKNLANQDTTGDGKRDYSGSGRKILRFKEQGVKANSGRYYCWPNPKYPFKWSQWKDWTKIKPFCKMTFMYNGRNYMVSLSLFDEEFDNRGFRACDLDWTPPLAWLTADECADIMKLTIVRKFTRECIKRINKYLKYTPKEIIEKTNNKDKLSEEEVEKTQKVIKHVMDSALKNNQADNYKFED